MNAEELSKTTPRKLNYTTTPAPNDYEELVAINCNNCRSVFMVSRDVYEASGGAECPRCALVFTRAVIGKAGKLNL